MKNCLIVFCLLSVFCSCDWGNVKNSVYKKNDGLSSYIDLANNDTIPIPKRIDYIHKALAIISKQENDTTKRSNYFTIANRYYNIGDYGNFKKYTKEAIRLSEIVNDTANLAKGYTFMSDYYITVNKPDSVYDYNYNAEKLYRKSNDKVNLTQTLLNKAVLLHTYSDFLGCEKTAVEMLQILKEYDNIKIEYEANNLLGIVYADLEEFELSKKYYDLAIEVANRENVTPTYHYKAVTFNNLGVMYSKKEDYSRATTEFSKALQEQNLFKDRPDIFAMSMDNLAYANMKLKRLDKPDMFYRALKIRDSLNIVPGIITSKKRLSEFYAERNDTIKSVQFAKDAYSVAKENKQKRSILEVLKQLSKIDPDEARKYASEYYEIKDSLDVVEHKTKNKFARIEFETDELAQDNIQLVEQRKTLIYIALGIILIGVFVFVIRVQAAKNRELRLIQEQQKANEEIYSLMISQQDKVEESRQAEKKRIGQELHDGVLGKLFGTRMNLGVLNARKDDESIDQRVAYIDELKTLEQEIREISHDLNSEKTAVFNNFVLMVHNFIETQRAVCQADIVLVMDKAIEWNAVENTAKINLYRILQEAFQNINKHAKAQNVSVTFKHNNSHILLEVKDDGIGFIYSRKRNGIGLQNMLSRITISGGTMEIITNPDEGTLLHFELPPTPNLNI